MVLHPTPLPPAVRDELDDAPVADAAWHFGRAVRTAVPHRFQLGEVGCGLYALGMLTDYWHRIDAANPTALVKKMDEVAAREGARAAAAAAAAGSTEARRAARRLEHHMWGEREGVFAEARLLETMQAEVEGTVYGEAYACEYIAELARRLGYRAVARRDASLEALWRCLDAGHPVIVCVDINNTHTFMPDQLGGQHTHFAVVEGYFDAAPSASEPPRRFLIVQQTNRRAPIPSVWPLDVFEPSWRGAGWRGRYRRRRMPPRVAAQLAWRPHEADTAGAPVAAGAGRLVLDSRAPPLEGDALAALHSELIAAGLLEPADEGAVRLAPDQELHHEDELRQMFIEVVPASHELS